jgi:hypothetical protein
LELDLGVLYGVNDKLTLGATLQNLGRGSAGESLTWSTEEKEQLPTNLKLGAAYKVIENVTLVIESNSALGVNVPPAFCGGAEWQANQFIALRTGFDQKIEAIDPEKIGTFTRYSAGVGLSYAGFRFDYAYRYDPIYQELSAHYFSISYLGPVFKKPVENKESPLARYEQIIGGEPVNGQVQTQGNQFENENIEIEGRLPKFEEPE